jgi:hypothetical protein
MAMRLPVARAIPSIRSMLRFMKSGMAWSGPSHQLR